MIARYAGSAALAIAVTFGLFFLMQLLVATGEKALTDTESGPSIDITRQQREEQTREKERELPDKPKPQKPPEQPKFEKTQTLRPGASSVNVNTNMNTGFDGAGINLGAAPSDGDILPLVRVPPQYPRRAQIAGIEGYVILEFNVSKEGTVVNPQVIEAKPEGVFDRAAVRAVEKFKYKPKIVNGKPAVRRGVQFKMTFQLNE